jgi:hypothetical protein
MIDGVLKILNLPVSFIFYIFKAVYRQKVLLTHFSDKGVRP